MTWRCTADLRASWAICLALAGVFLPATATGQSGGPPGEKTLTAEQERQLKERDRLAASATRLESAQKHAEAVTVLEKALAIERTVLGPLHGRTANTLNRLAGLYAYAGDFAAARKAAQELLAARLKGRGEKHWTTVDARATVRWVERMAGLSKEDRARLARARSLTAQLPALAKEGKAAVALPLAHEALEIHRRLLGEDAVQTSGSLSWVASLLQKLRDYAGARSYYEQALDMHRRTRGEDHPGAAVLLNNLGQLLSTQGELARARQYLEQAVASVRKLRGLNHADTATTLRLLAQVQRDLGDHEAARSSGRQALTVRVKALGEKHPQTASAANFLADVCARLARQQERSEDFLAARAAWQEALELRTQWSGAGHWRTVDARLALANAELLSGLTPAARRQLADATRQDAAAEDLQKKGQLDKAAAAAREALRTRAQILGAEHRDTALAQHALGQLYLKAGDYARAEPPLRRAVELRRKLLGEAHPDFAASLGVLADLFARLAERREGQENLAAARKACREVIALKVRLRGEKHWEVTDARLALARVERLAQLDAKQLARLAEVERQRQQFFDLRRAGKHREALAKAGQALEACRQLWGAEHPACADWLDNAGRTHVSLGEIGQAEKPFRAALAIRKKAQGEEHPDYAGTLLWVGILHSRKAEYAQAEPFYRRALEIRERTLGEKDALTRESMSWLADVCGWLAEQQESKDDYAAAHRARQEVVVLRARVNGTGHWETVNARWALARAEREAQLPKDDRAALREAQRLYDEARRLRDQGKARDALPLARQAAVTYRRLLGDGFPDTARLVNYVGVLLAGQGDLAGARKQYEEALAIRRKVLGDAHPDTILALNNVGAVLSDLRDYAAARGCLEQALAASRKLLGATHTETLTSLDWLAELAQKQGDYAGARGYYEQMLAAYRKLYGEYHVETAWALNQVGLMLVQLGQLEDARACYERALAVRKKVQGDGHVDTVTPLNNLGHLLAAQGDRAEARKYYEQALAISRKARGNDDPDTLVILGNLGTQLLALGETAAARKCYEEALATCRKVLGEGHADTALALDNLARLLVNQGDDAGALPYYEQTLAIRRKALGAKHPDTLACLQNLARAHDRLAEGYALKGDFAAALKERRQVLDLKRALGEKSWEGIDARVALAQTERLAKLDAGQRKRLADLEQLAGQYDKLKSASNYREALPAAQRALEAARQLWGEEHSTRGFWLHAIGEAEFYVGDMAKSEAAFRQALAVRGKILGERHPDYAVVLAWLAFLHERKGEYERAEVYYRQSYEARKEALGPKDAITQRNLHGLIEVCTQMAARHEGKEEFAAARRQRQEVIALKAELYGAGHWEVTDARWALTRLDRWERLAKEERARLREAQELSGQAGRLHRERKFAEALAPAQKVLKIRQEILGNVHPDTIAARMDIAVVYDARLEYTAAQPYWEQAADDAGKALGTNHPTTALALLNYGQCLHQQGEAARSRPVFEQAVAAYRKARGTEHADTAQALLALGRARQQLGDVAGARACYDEALAVCRKVHGEAHPATARALNNLALLCQDERDYARARSYLERALAVRRKALGEAHAEVALALQNLGNLLRDVGDYTAARPYAEQAVAVYLKAVGADHPATARALNNLGLVLTAQGEYEAARGRYEQALAIYRKHHGDGHPDTALVLNNLGHLLQQQGDTNGARFYYEWSLAVYRKARGDGSLEVARALNNLGTVLASQGDGPAARKYLEQALGIHRKVQGEGHPNTALALANLGDVLYRQGDLAGARKCFEPALEAFRKALGENHADTARQFDNLAYLLRDQGDFAAAQSHFERAVSGRRQALGPAHPDYAQSVNALAALHAELARRHEKDEDFAAARKARAEVVALKTMLRAAGHWEVTDARLALARTDRLAALDAAGRRALLEAERREFQVVGLMPQQKYREALALARQVQDTYASMWGKEHTAYGRALTNLGIVYLRLGELAKAEPLLRQGLEIRRQALGAAHPDCAYALTALAEVADRKGDLAAAVALYRQSFELRSRALGGKAAQTVADFNVLLGVCDRLAAQHEQRDDFEAACAVRREVVGIKERQYGAGHWEVTNARIALANSEQKRGLGKEERARWREGARLFGEANGLRRQGKWDQALPPARRALEITRALLGEDHADTAAALTQVGKLHLERAEFNQAQSLYEQSLTVRRKVYGEAHPATADALADLAAVLAARGDPAGARPYREQALAVRQKALGHRHPATALALLQLGGVLREQGEFAAARRHLTQALVVYRQVRGEQHADTAAALDGLGLLLEEQGEFIDAGKLYDQALAVRKKALGEGHPLTAASLARLGNLNRLRGHPAVARRYFDQALAVYRKAHREGHPDIAGVLNQLGILLQNQGDSAAARDAYEQALAIDRKAWRDGHPSTAAVLHNLAKSLQSQGEHGPARKYYEEALAINARIFGKRHPNTAHVLSSLGTLLQAQGKYEEAGAYFRQAVAIRTEALGKDHPTTAAAVGELGRLLEEQGDYKGAREHYEKSLAIYVQVLGEQHANTAAAYSKLGQLLHARGKYAEAAPALEKHLRIRLRLTRDLLGSLSEAEALAHVESTQSGRDPLLSVLRRVPGTRPEQAYQFVWETRGLVTSAVATRRPPVGAGALARQLWEQLHGKRAELARLTLAVVPPDRAEARRKQLVRLTAEKEDLERRLGEASASFRQGLLAEQAGPAELAARLPRGAAVLDVVQSVFWEPPADGVGKMKGTVCYEAFVLRRTDKAPGYRVAWVHLGPAAAIDRAVRAWRGALVGQAAPWDGDERPEQALRRLVWEKVEAHLDGCSTVVVVPDAALTAVPWAALPGKRSGSYLLEEYALCTASHGRQLYETLGRKADTGGRLLVVGGVQYDAPATTPAGSATVVAERGPARDAGDRPAWGFLRGAQAEAEEIVALWGKRATVTLLKETAATEAGVRERMPGSRYVHLATHGFFADARFRSAFQIDAAPQGQRAKGRAAVTERNPLILSGVVLAGANVPQPLGADGLPVGDDGILTAEEVVGLDLAGCELVVLSACETGLGEVAGGEGVFGLQRAFGLAGARSVVASLWQVDDAATRKLMTLFYENLWQKKLPRLEALRQAQLTLLRGVGPGGAKRGLDLDDDVPAKGSKGTARAHPRLWAAWLLSGDPGDLSQIQVALPTAEAPAGAPGAVHAEGNTSGFPFWLYFAAGGLAVALVLTLASRAARRARARA